MSKQHSPINPIDGNINHSRVTNHTINEQEDSLKVQARIMNTSNEQYYLLFSLVIMFHKQIPIHKTLHISTYLH